MTYEIEPKMNQSIWNDLQYMPVLSSGCQASCSYCFGPNQGAAVTPEFIKHIVHYINAISQTTGQTKLKVTFHGGEPLLAGLPVWEAALAEFKKAGSDRKLKFNVQSNLWNLDEDFCRLFQTYGVTIGSSLDGPEEINDRQRGKGYFQKTMRGFRLASSFNLKAGCIATFTPDNVAAYHEVFEFFKENKLPFSIHCSVPAIGKPSHDYILSPEEYGDLLCNMLDLYIPNRHYIQISLLDQLCRSLVIQEGEVCTFKDCLGMFLAFDPQGNIYSCQRFCGKPEYALGNIKSEPSLESLISSRVARNILLRQERVKRQCAGCEHYPYCKGGCLYNAWAAGSDIDPYCAAYKKIFTKMKERLLEEMQSEENIRAIADKPYAGIGHPLLRKGPLIELTRKDTHPSKIAQNALKIMALVELGKSNSVQKTCESLLEMGLPVTGAEVENLDRNLHTLKNTLNNLYIHLTFKCQLRCNHCYATANQSNEEFMPLDKIEQLVLTAKKLQFRQVVFTGGEPLLHPALGALLEWLAWQKNSLTPMHLVLRSNFVRELSIAEIKRIAGAFTKIIVSVDGDRDYHDDRRGKGSYEATVKNLDNYQSQTTSIKNSAELSLACVLSNNSMNPSLSQAVYSLAQKLNIRQVRFRPILPIGKAGAWDIPPVSEAISSFKNIDDLLISGISPANSCGMGQNLYVEPNGDSFPCYAFHKKHTFLENVFEQGLETIITSKNFRELSKHTVDTNPKCNECLYRYICGGACRAWGSEQTQYNLDAPPPECNGLYQRAEEIYLAAIHYLKEI